MLYSAGGMAATTRFMTWCWYNLLLQIKGTKGRQKFSIYWFFSVGVAFHTYEKTESLLVHAWLFKELCLIYIFGKNAFCILFFLVGLVIRIEFICWWLIRPLENRRLEGFAWYFPCIIYRQTTHVVGRLRLFQSFPLLNKGPRPDYKVKERITRSIIVFLLDFYW